MTLELSITERLWRAKSGTRAQQSALINDPDTRVLSTLAIYATQATQTKLLKTNPNIEVRRSLAKYGTPAVQQLLLTDEDWQVRADLAYYGDDYTRSYLQGDTDTRVQQALLDTGGQALAIQTRDTMLERNRKAQVIRNAR